MVRNTQRLGSRRKRRRVAQLAFEFRTWGGARKGAGRPPKGDKPGMPHVKRPALAARFPVHVTVRMLPHVWNLRSRRSFRVIDRSVGIAAERFGMRLCGFSVQGNHLHLVIEASDARALSRGMKGLCVRLAKGLNRMMVRTGPVLADRYHAHVLRTPSETRNAVHYVRHNHRKHVTGSTGPFDAPCMDGYSFLGRTHGVALAAPRTWLLRECVRRLSGGPGG